MLSNKKTARLVGVLFLLQMLAAIISHEVILTPLLESENFLSDISANSSEVKIAILFDLICGASLFGIAILMFPILKQLSERIALWYVGIRLGELLTWVVAGVFLLILLSVSQQYVQAETLQSPHFDILGKALKTGRNSVIDLHLVIYCLGAVMFYFLFVYIKTHPPIHIRLGINRHLINVCRANVDNIHK